MKKYVFWIFLSLIVIGYFANKQIQKDFEANKAKIIADMELYYGKGDFDRVIAIGGKYETVDDYEFKKLYEAAKNKVGRKNTEISADKGDKKSDSQPRNLEATQISEDNKTDKPNIQESGGFFSNLFKSSAKIEGDVASTHELISLNADLDMVGRQIASTIYNVAVDYPKIKVVRVKVELNGSTVLGTITDNYGKRISGPYMMGEIEEKSLDEIRRYNSASAYADRMKGIYALQVKRLNYGHFWKK